MPYFSSDPDDIEVVLSTVLTFLDELETGILVTHNLEYHPQLDPFDAASPEDRLDEETAKLCDRIKKLLAVNNDKLADHDLSLEMQIWWRDYQDLDKRRELGEEQRRAAEIHNQYFEELEDKVLIVVDYDHVIYAGTDLESASTHLKGQYATVIDVWEDEKQVGHYTYHPNSKTKPFQFHSAGVTI